MSKKPAKPDDECVKVMVRCRPMNSKEKGNGSKNCIEVIKDINQIVLTNQNKSDDENVRAFTYDAVYGENST